MNVPFRTYPRDRPASVRYRTDHPPARRPRSWPELAIAYQRMPPVGVSRAGLHFRNSCSDCRILVQVAQGTISDRRREVCRTQGQKKQMNTQPAEHADAEARRQYVAIRATLADSRPIAVLHIGEGRTAVALGSGAQPDTVLVVEIGARKTAVRHFRHDAPNADELENAITAIEDALMPVRAEIPNGSTLKSMDAGIREIAHAAGLPHQPKLKLHRDSVEQTFRRLADVAHGRPASHDPLPPGAGFAARLLILREFMQHLEFEEIAVRG